MSVKWVGWQADGSYVPCNSCHWEPLPPPRDPPPGFALDVFPHSPGTVTHHGNCPLIDLPREVKEELAKKFDEMDRCRRRAEVNARNFFIG